MRRELPRHGVRLSGAEAIAPLPLRLLRARSTSRPSPAQARRPPEPRPAGIVAQPEGDGTFWLTAATNHPALCAGLADLRAKV